MYIISDTVKENVKKLYLKRHVWISGNRRYLAVTLLEVPPESVAPVVNVLSQSVVEGLVIAELP